jgi:signal transduction histidine kinase
MAKSRAGDSRGGRPGGISTGSCHRGAHSATVVLREADSVLRFSVCDDGPGMIDAKARVGAGLINMEDRVSTVGGELTVRSRPGQGTCVSGRIPLSALARASGTRSEERRSVAFRPRQRDHLR